MIQLPTWRFQDRYATYRFNQATARNNSFDGVQLALGVGVGIGCDWSCQLDPQRWSGAFSYDGTRTWKPKTNQPPRRLAFINLRIVGPHACVLQLCHATTNRLLPAVRRKLSGNSTCVCKIFRTGAHETTCVVEKNVSTAGRTLPSHINCSSACLRIGFGPRGPFVQA